MGDNVNKAKALEALATAGTRGLDALAQGQWHVAEARNAALDQALGAAGQRGAPSALQQQLAATIAAPADRSVMQLDTARARLGEDLARQQAATGSYFDQADAAVPAIQADVAARVRAAWAKGSGGGGGSGGGKTGGLPDDAQWVQKALSRGLAEQARTAQLADANQQLLQEVANLRANHAPQPRAAAMSLPAGSTVSRGHMADSVDQRAFVGRQSGLLHDATQRIAGAAGLPAMVAAPGGPAPSGQRQATSDEVLQALTREIAGLTPPPDVQAQRDSYMALYGASPETEALARGLFPIPDAGQTLQGLREQDQLDYYQQHGVRDPGELQRMANAEQGYADTQSQQDVKGSDEYAEAADLAESMALAGAPMNEQGEYVDDNGDVTDVPMPFTLDDLRWQLRGFSPQVVQAVLDEYGRRFYNSTFEPPATGG